MKLKEIKTVVLGAKTYMGTNGIGVVMSEDNTPKWGKLKHVSISKPDRYPTWDEIIAIKLLLFGDRKDAMMVMPKREDYVNVHKFCFHIWECPEEWGLQ